MKRNFYRSGGDVVELIITDCTGRKLFKWKSNASDAKGLANILNEYIEKYDLKVFVKYYGDISTQESKDFFESLRKFDWS